MTTYGKLNLLGMLIMPVVATLTAVMMFGPLPDMMAAVFGINAIPMLIAGLISALLLRSANKFGGAGRSVAIWPTLILAAIGVVWYLWGAFLPAEADPGREYLAVPQYLLVLAFVVGLIAWIGCRIARARRVRG